MTEAVGMRLSICPGWRWLCVLWALSSLVPAFDGRAGQKLPPNITSQPQDLVVVTGDPAVFSVTATGTAPLYYQWRKNGTSITGATASIYRLAATTTNDAAGYDVVVRNNWGSVTSSLATLTVYVSPWFSRQPTNLTATAGSDAILTVEAQGIPAPALQWYFGNSALDGETAPTLSLPNVRFSQAGTYYCLATNAIGSAASTAVSLVVICPSITLSPASLPGGTLGDAYAQSLGASGGSAPYAYLVVSGILPSGLGLSSSGVLSGTPAVIGNFNFIVRATDINGCFGSRAYTLSVTGVPPAITLQPQSRTNVMGTDAGFSVTASGTIPLAYQWQFNGAAIPGATASNLVRSAVSFADAGAYRVVVTNVVGALTSTVATLTVVCPSVTLSPASVPAAMVGSAFSQTLSANGGAAPYVYSVESGSVAPGLGLSPGGVLSGTPTAVGSFSFVVRATDNNGCVGSQPYSLVVTGSPPLITLQPQSRTNAPGTTAAFSVTATGTGPLSYQWRLGGVGLVDDGRITGATTATLQVASVQPGDAGNYTVIISNAAGVVTSAIARLTVTGPPTITTQPASLSVMVGADVSFSVSASGTLPLSYQWQFNGAGIAGASASSLLLTNVQLANAGNYLVVVTNVAGSVTSAVASLTVTLSPQPGVQNAGAVVLINSQSARYPDFQHFIQPYLDNFGFPYTVQDIATGGLGLAISNCAVIIVGHRQLDTNHTYLNTTIQASISQAVSNGAGLVSFDSDLFAGSTPYYQFVQDIFGFTYGTGASGSSASLPPTESFLGMHYITARHPTNDLIPFRSSIALPGISVPAGATTLVTVGGQPLVTAVKFGQGRAVQWGSYDWMTSTVLGPVDGLDDVVWRGVVWAARKPFVMRGLPNFVTMRVDDVSGPFWWLHAANGVGFKPFVAFFYQLVSEASAADLQALTTSGNATASIHSTDSGSAFFYFNHSAGQPWPDDVQSNNFYLGTLWHTNHGIPISKICATHFSEIGLNCFSGLKAWGIDFVPIEVVPGDVEYGSPPAPWLPGGPYRLYEPPQPGQVSWPTYYADWLTVPGHPEFDGQFFNIYSEVRDVAACGQWCPNNSDVAGSITGAVHIARRALDSMVMATIFTHESFVDAVSAANFEVILQGITNGLASYNPVYVTLDYASQYVRATRTSRVLSSAYDPVSGQVTATFSGKTDLATQVYVFLGADSSITNNLGVVPAFSGSVTNTVAVLSSNPMLPSIVNQPGSLATNTGATVGLTVSALGTTPLSYQWFKDSMLLANGGNVSGASSPTLVLTSVSATNSGSYQVVVTNVVGGTTSSVATLTVVSPLAIMTQPKSQSVVAGSDTSFSVMASGALPLSYQWRFNGTNIGGATGTNLLLTGVQQPNAGNYTVVVTNLSGSVTSTVATLTVLVPPAISIQPASLSVASGTNISFSTVASGTQPLGYRWQFRGTNLFDGGQFSGAASAVLYISNVEPSNQGDYRVVITNAVGSAVSAAATLTVSQSSVCLQSATGLVGWWPGDGNANDIAGTNNGTLHTGVTGGGAGVVGTALSFDGSNGYVQIPDAPALRPTNLTVEAWVNFSGLDSALSGTAPPGDQYIVFKQNSRVYNFEGYSLEKYRTANGDVFMFSVGSSSGQEVFLRSSTLISPSVWYHVAAVRGTNFMELYVNGHIEGRTNVAFAQDYGNNPLYFGTSAQTYWDGKLRGQLDEVSLYNRALTSDEIAAVYAAGSAGKCKAPRIATQPQSQTVGAGTSALLTVTATGVGSLSYQWQFNGANIAGATGTGLALNNVQLANAGNYTVVVTNALGSVSSAPAVLSVTGRPLLLGPRVGAGGIFIFTLSGTPGLTYQVEVSSNLQDWAPLALVSLITGQADFTDTIPSNSTSRFYRARLP
jgi:hypothetical protein